MLKRLSCTNFRGFGEFSTDLDEVTAFLGPNSSGKTSALHAVRFACDALRLAIDTGTARAGDDPDWVQVTRDTLVDHTQLLPLADWQALFVDQTVGDSVSLEVVLTFDDTDPVQAIHVELACARNEQLKLAVYVRSSEARRQVVGLSRRSSKVNQRLTAFLAEHAPIAVFVPPFYGTVRREEYRSRAVVDRLLGSGDQSHVVRNLVVDLSAEQLGRLNAFLDDTIGARITQRTSQDDVQRVTHLTVQFRDDNGDIELSAAGAGLVNLVALYTSLSRWRSESRHRRVLFLLDEPEAHLHPRLQADMTERLATLVTREFAGQLVLATHSVDILNRLSVRGARLVRCDRRARPAALALDSDSALFDDLASWVDLTPFTAINFLASRRVVFCEGDDELSLMPRLGELAYRNHPARAAALARWTFVRLFGSGNRHTSSLLAQLLRSDVVRARAQEATFHVEMLLDRDYERTPGTTTTERDHIVETTTVWPMHSLESLLLVPDVLATWVRAFAHECTPADLDQQIVEALAAADGDSELNAAAEARLMARLHGSELLDDDGRPLHGDRKLHHALRRARAMVAEHPSIWQRGKDRGRFVLQRLRPHIALPRRNQFPTDVIRLVARADLDRIGQPRAAIPAAALDVLDRLSES